MGRIMLSRCLPVVLMFMSALPMPVLGQAETVFTAQLLGSNQVPPVASQAGGTCTAVLNAAGNLLNIGCTYADLAPVPPPGVMGSVHIHNAPVGENGGIVFDLTPAVNTMSFGAADGSIGFDGSFQATLPLTPAQAVELRAGRYYVNMHTVAHPGGEIRGQLGYVQSFEPVAFQAILRGQREVPPVQTDAVGACDGLLNAARTAFTLTCQHTLNTAEPGGHIHIGPAGVNGDIVFNLPGLGESPLQTVWGVVPPLAPGRPAINRPLSPEMVAHLLEERLYVNLHSALHPGGELRGQIVRLPPVAEGIPTLSSMAMLLLGAMCAGLGLLALRRRQGM